MRFGRLTGILELAMSIKSSTVSFSLLAIFLGGAVYACVPTDTLATNTKHSPSVSRSITTMSGRAEESIHDVQSSKNKINTCCGDEHHAQGSGHETRICFNQALPIFCH